MDISIYTHCRHRIKFFFQHSTSLLFFFLFPFFPPSFFSFFFYLFFPHRKIFSYFSSTQPSQQKCRHKLPSRLPTGDLLKLAVLSWSTRVLTLVSSPPLLRSSTTREYVLYRIHDKMRKSKKERRASWYFVVGWVRPGRSVATWRGWWILRRDPAISKPSAALFSILYFWHSTVLRFLLAAILTKFFQVLIDGPTTGVPRQGVALAHVVLTPHVVAKLPRAARSSAVAKKWEASEIDAKWAKSAWAQKIAQRQRRAALSDFERFQVLLLKKQQRLAVNKAATKA